MLTHELEPTLEPNLLTRSLLENESIVYESSQINLEWAANHLPPIQPLSLKTL